MKHKSSSEDSGQPQQTINGPGSQLRKARERQGLELAKVATQLHLNQAMVHALEWDDYDKLPAAVFVQGYLRKYARLLGVDEDTIILTYQEMHPGADQQPLPRSQPDEVALELGNEFRLLRYFAWGLLLLLVIALIFWWQGRMETSEPQGVSGEEQELIEPALPLREQTDLGPAREQALPPLRAPGAEQNATRADTPDAAAERLIAPPVPSPAPEAQESPPQAAETSQADALPPPFPTTAAEPSPAEAPLEAEASPAIATDQVVFEFTGPCWVEVRDAGGRARILGVMREGTRRSLNAGLGPFRIVIGDIFSVRLSVKGEAYDLRRHTRGKVARFTLDPSRL